ncbi:MAG: HlyC/CorC family transporter [Sedimentisphaerales bacterium]|nr:HlyC/CorC family transporter [Sedimentisphaerales bacterium]
MSYSVFILILICFLSAGMLFFSVNVLTLRRFSRAKLQEAFKSSKSRKSAEQLAEELITNAEKLLLACSLYRIVFNVGILLLLFISISQSRQGALRIIDYFLMCIITVVIFSIFSVAIPHFWSKYSGENFLSKTYKFLVFSTAIVFPFVKLLKLYDGLIRRLVGAIETTPEEQQEEFLTDLEQHRMEGVVDEEEQEMIENVLELTDSTADEIMTPRTYVVAVEVNSELPTVLDTITSAGHSRVPVYESNIDNIVGLIYAKDLLKEIGKDPSDFRLRDKMRKAYFVPETKPLRALLHEFQNQKLHIAVVLDEYGGTAGIVTIEDILEELVGEITDEYEKTPAEPVKKIDKDTIEIDARTSVDDLNDEFELNLPEDEDYETAGGFVFSHLGYIPKTGESFGYQNLRFTITSSEPRRIKRIRIHTRSDISSRQ